MINKPRVQAICDSKLTLLTWVATDSGFVQQASVFELSSQENNNKARPLRGSVVNFITKRICFSKKQNISTLMKFFTLDVM